MINVLKRGCILALYLLVLVVPNPAQAQTPTAETIEALLAKIETLQTIITQRVDYAATGATTEGAQEYYYFALAAEPELTLFGRSTKEVEVKTDLDALQLLVVTDCESDFVLFAGETCKRETWITTAEIEEWTRTYAIPVRFVGEETEADTTFEIYACRYNGCMLEGEVAVTYKATKTFADEVTIKDRYEWEYESDNTRLHTQEVLVSFPQKQVQKVTLDVSCNDHGLSVKTYNDQTVSCYESVTYTRPEFRDILTDELGNSYNLELYTMTKGLEAGQSGTMLLEFTFYGQNNRLLAEVSHRPVQKEEIAE